MKKIFLSFLVLAFTACSYAPSAHLAKQTLAQNVYLKVDIDKQDPRNSVYIIDTMRALLMQKLGLSLVPKDKATDFITLKVKSLNFIPVIYDENGYVINYKAVLTLKISVRHKDGKAVNFTTTGNYHFDISPNTIISDTARFNAIKYASSKAFDEFISQLAIRGLDEG